MQNKSLSEQLIQFIEWVNKKTHAATGLAATIVDLRLECRTQRLTEYADWPMTELELIEQEAACYGDETKLSQLLSGEILPNPIQEKSWLDSPSPFAWT